MPSEWLGRNLGEYFIYERLGVGSMAEVYKATQHSMQRTVGVKLLPSNLSGDAQFVARFKREAQIAASLEHPHILPIIDFGDGDGTLFLVMRYVNGGTLHDLIERGPLPPAIALRYLTEIGEALDYAHARRIVHRDVKPKNVLLDEQGNPFLADFGLARLMEDGGLTKSGLEMIGTPHYMSPEQARGHPVDGRSDLYSLGVVLYQMLTGCMPFTGESAVGIVMQHIGTPVPPASQTCPGLPPSLDPVLARAMAKDPAERYQSARDLIEAVAGALGASVLAGPVVTRPVGSSAFGSLASWWRRVFGLPPALAPRPGEASLSFWRKLYLLGHWLRHRLTPGQTSHETLPAVLKRLFPGRRQQTLLVGSLLLTTAASVGLMSLLTGALGGQAPQSAAGTPPASAPAATPLVIVVTATGDRQAAPGQQPATQTPMAVAAFSTATPASHNPSDAPVTTAPEGGLPAADVPLPTDPASGLAPPSPIIWPSDAMTLVYVPEGPFLLGAADDDQHAREDEKPQVTIHLDAFWIDRTEVTVAQFQEFVSGAGYQTDAERGCCEASFAITGGVVYSPQPIFVRNATWRLPHGSGAPAAAPRHPVTQVSWNDASAYCEWAGRRLPTEAEWEKAARGPDGLIYPWGNEFDGRRLNFCDSNCSAEWQSSANDSFARTGTAGVFPAGASPYDAYDMAGNVWEWVNDYYDFRGWFRVPTANPPGQAGGLTRVLRGGSWLDSPDRVRTTARNYHAPDARNNVTGFRCAVSQLP
jgi:formylglycine-generating enzyme required for sulfatase activity